ncbi:hypothetical protein A2U01_0009756, partial [Trifolium medium]|nr:hypothetical protein [Trifolium medium]
SSSEGLNLNRTFLSQRKKKEDDRFHIDGERSTLVEDGVRVHSSAKCERHQLKDFKAKNYLF